MKKNRLMLPILAVIAGVAASAFTTVEANVNKDPNQYLFYSTTGIPSTDPNDYVFDDRPGAGCIENQSKVCSAIWEQSTSPTTLSHPTGTKVTSDAPNEYQPGL